ncbi:bifunctional nuclease family protein [Pseudonocardia sp. TRM90224]|uniref:bifunctional nuclease family protein n=1 Tax=Pseudonocardia sp. TRM90224 TaxID=2812678 RepID=UPI001E2C345A|nr:bifunctional nuclease family protein [Pseudonocardia sp. TRM90224]
MSTVPEVQVMAIALDALHGTPVLLIQERGGANRILPVALDLPEAVAIESELEGRHSPRPATHELVGLIVDALGRRIDHVDLDAPQDGGLEAELVLDQDTRFPARVSDAVAVALHDGVPIRASDDLLDIAEALDLTIVVPGGAEATDAAPEPESDPETGAPPITEAEIAQFSAELDERT